MELKDLIRAERMKRGWSQRTLAKALGVTHGAVAQWETGDSGLTFPRLLSICTVFGLDAASFLGPGSPYGAQLVQDADELALLVAFRHLPEDQRLATLRMIEGAARSARPSDLDPPKNKRKRA